MCSTVQLFLQLIIFCSCVIDTTNFSDPLFWAVREWLKYKNKLGDRMIIMNSVVANYRHMSVSHRSACHGVSQLLFPLAIISSKNRTTTDSVTEWFFKALHNPRLLLFYCISTQSVCEQVSSQRISGVKKYSKLQKKKALSGGRELITVEKMHKKIHETLMKRALQTASNDKTKYLNIAWDAKKQQKDLIYEGALVKQKL